MQSVSSLHTPHLGRCGLGPGELGQEEGEDATNSFPSFGKGVEGTGGSDSRSHGTCPVVLGRYAPSLLSLENCYYIGGGEGEGFSVNPITPLAFWFPLQMLQWL